MFIFLTLGFAVHLWDLSFPTRDSTYTPVLEVWSLNHWTAREVPPFFKMELMVSPAITHKTIKEHKHLDGGGIIKKKKKKSLELSYAKVGHGVPRKDPSGEIPIWVLTTGLGFQV